MGKKKTLFEKTKTQLSNKWHFVENITKYYAVCFKNIANLLVSLLHKMYFWGCFLTCSHCLKIKNQNDSLCADYAK